MDTTATVNAEVCGPEDFAKNGTLNQGDAVHIICIMSKAFPEASIAGIHTWT
jgi:hypothetical protein